MMEISDEAIRSMPDFQAALRVCVQLSGKRIKTVAIELEIEESHLSRMLSTVEEDRRHFPPNKIEALMEVCGNEIPLRWLEMRRGYPSPRKVAALEAELKRLQEENAELKGDSKALVNVFKFFGSE